MNAANVLALTELLDAYPQIAGGTTAQLALWLAARGVLVPGTLDAAQIDNLFVALDCCRHTPAERDDSIKALERIAQGEP